MSDEGDRTCPLCAEEMDLTDQQLKPCKCGYDICVWCWHHIMDMAEKDETEGRCPACRSPYDKEKIVGTAAKCERLVAEISSERKVKSQKMKMKTSEGRKQLSSVRVIQRNLVYIVGLPLNLADEDVLQQREYFGQYGKVLKVSMSRTATGVIQQFPNNTCSVYITYGKEEEAVRCIQCVHGFMLDGRSLRACFGTTKYCHAWLRNVACTNPDCLYLHEVGSQEDSFTKDEIVSAYTRSRLQITGSTNDQQRRSGSVLPPPVDEYCNSSSASTAKPIIKSVSNSTSAIARGSPPNGSSGSLPTAAAWGMQTANCQPPAATSAGSNGPAKPKSDANCALLGLSVSDGSTAQGSMLPTDVSKNPTLHEETHRTLGKVKSDSIKSRKHVSVDDQISMPEKSATPDRGAASLTSNDQVLSLPALKDNDNSTSHPLNSRNTSDFIEQNCSLGTEKADKLASSGKIQNLCSDMSSMNIDRNMRSEHSGVSRPNSYTDHGLTKPSSQGSQHFTEQYREPSTLSGTSESMPAKLAAYDGICGSTNHLDLRSDSNTQVSNTSFEVEEDIVSFDNQRLKDPEVGNYSTYLPNSPNLIRRSHCIQPSEATGAVNINADPIFGDDYPIDRPLLNKSNVSASSNGHLGHQENLASAAAQNGMVENSIFLGNQMQMSGASNITGTTADKGENNIISNILAMDFDVWGDSLTSPQTLAKLLGDSDMHSGSSKISSPWKAHNNNQSRFSFARQEDSRNQVFDGIGQLDRNGSVNRDSAENSDSFFDNTGLGYGFSYNKHAEFNVASSNSAFSSTVSRGQVSAPPGFSMPSRAPPPGFFSHERMDQAFNSLSGNHLLDTSSILTNSYPVPPTGNIGSNTGDIEFMDPAILAVGKGRLQGGHNNAGLDMRSNFTQLNAFENEARLRLLMQKSVPQQQNLRYHDVGDSYSLNDSYRRLMDQSHVNSLSPYPQLSVQQQSRNAGMPNGHWDGWNEVQSGNSLGVAELLRNERLGFNKFYTGYEDSKFRMPSSGDMYNRTFGM